MTITTSHDQPGAKRPKVAAHGPDTSTGNHHSSSSRNPATTAATTTTTGRADRITWTCDVCHEAIPHLEGAGIITVHYRDIDRFERSQQAMAERAKEHNSGFQVVDLSELLTNPRAKFAAFHRNCDPQPGSPDDYWFDTERAGDIGRVLNWTLHLSGKSWYQSTDWPEFIYRHLRGQVNTRGLA